MLHRIDRFFTDFTHFYTHVTHILHITVHCLWYVVKYAQHTQPRMPRCAVCALWLSLSGSVHLHAHFTLTQCTLDVSTCHGLTNALAVAQVAPQNIFAI